MFVRNKVGYDISLKYKNVVITIPYDGIIYSIPNDMDTYGHCDIIMPANVRTQKVIYINKKGTISNIEGLRRRGRPNKKRDPKKPLKGTRIPKEKKELLEKNIKEKMNKNGSKES